MSIGSNVKVTRPIKQHKRSDGDDTDRHRFMLIDKNSSHFLMYKEQASCGKALLVSSLQVATSRAGWEEERGESEAGTSQTIFSIGHREVVKNCTETIPSFAIFLHTPANFMVHFVQDDAQLFVLLARAASGFSLHLHFQFLHYYYIPTAEKATSPKR